MNREISNLGCNDIGELGPGELLLDRNRSSFILRRRFRVLSGRRRLGLAWLMLDPIATSMVYVFVFTVIRSNPDLTSILIGISLFRILQSSFKSGVASVKDFTGGIKGERVRTRVLTDSMVRYRIIDSALQSIGVSLILIAMGIEFIGVCAFLISGQILGLISEGLGLNLATLTRRIPDLSNIVNYTLLLMFFASPALYPMKITSGMHYKINEFNPFSYFAESSRYLSGLDSVIMDLRAEIVIPVLIISLILALRGYSTLDKQRWEVSSWS